MGRRVQAVLFDLHDTLVRVHFDNLAERRQMAHRVLREWPGAPDYAAFVAADDAARAELHARGAGELRDFGVEYRFHLALGRLLPEPPPPALVTRMVDAYVWAWIHTLTPVPDAVAVLDALRPRYRLALVSDYGHAPGIDWILARFGLAGYFDPIVISVTVGHTKPHPAMFQTALAGLGGLAPETTLFVGDNPLCDVAGARQAGIRPILVDLAGRYPGFPGERIVALRDLLPLVAAADAELPGDGPSQE